MKIKQKITLATITLIILSIYYAILIPSIRNRLNSVFIEFQSGIFRYLNPPEEESFLPQVSNFEISTPSISTATDARFPNSAPPSVHNLSAMTATPRFLPLSIQLDGVIHEYQQWNNCGPATLAMALSFWNWVGDQRDTAAYLKPNSRDKNVSIQELVNYVNSLTNLRAISRVGGNLDTLRSLLSAGFPVIIERGLDGYDNEGWMGHYQLLTGYDDSQGYFYAQDALIMPDLPVQYAEIEAYWFHFNNSFIVIFPANLEQQLNTALGLYVDESMGYEISRQNSEYRINHTNDRDLFFSWFNLGTTALYFEDFFSAASSYDRAFLIYVSLPERTRPWRMMWYQHGPYQAYFETGRYQDVINLATFAISRTLEPALEESFFWRGQAEIALKDNEAGLSDLQLAVSLNPNFQQAIDAISHYSP